MSVCTVTAFPSLARERQAFIDAHGIDVDVSLAAWLGELTGRTPERVRELIVGALAEALQHDDADPVLVEVLSARERDVIRCAARGLSDQETAAALGLSYSGVAARWENVRRKLNTSSRVLTVLIAIASEQA